jgi:hypothetical protein
MYKRSKEARVNSSSIASKEEKQLQEQVSMINWFNTNLEFIVET